MIFNFVCPYQQVCVYCECSVTRTYEVLMLYTLNHVCFHVCVLVPHVSPWVLYGTINTCGNLVSNLHLYMRPAKHTHNKYTIINILKALSLKCIDLKRRAVVSEKIRSKGLLFCINSVFFSFFCVSHSHRLGFWISVTNHLSERSECTCTNVCP